VCVALALWAYARNSVFVVHVSPAAAHTAAIVLIALAAAFALLALAAPTLLRPVFIAMTAASLPIGWVVSHVVMLLFFYVIITPVGLVFRLIGRDPLHRQFEPGAATYWVRRESVTDVKRYYRQF
jgi:hypothetical protein